MIIAPLVYIGIFIGGLYAMLSGWMTSGEPFSRAKAGMTLLSLLIFTVTTSPALLSAEIDMSASGIAGLFATSVVAGMGVDKLQTGWAKQQTKIGNQIKAKMNAKTPAK